MNIPSLPACESLGSSERSPRLLARAMVAFGLMLGSIPALAHHSFANFDMEHDTTLTGVVKEFKWTNPHAYALISVADETGAMTDWLIEFGSQTGLSRRGWTRHSWQLGDTVKVVGHVSRDGSKLMTFTRASDAGGQPYPPPAKP